MAKTLKAPRNFPDLPFLAFLDFLVFFVAWNVLAFLSVFPFLPRDSRGSSIEKKSLFFGWFSLLFPKKQGKEDQGSLVRKTKEHTQHQGREDQGLQGMP